MKFQEGNRIRYMQDFSAWEGLPSDVDFDVIPLDQSGDSVKLVAPGYGGKPYGNGAIYLSRDFAMSGLTQDAPDLGKAPAKVNIFLSIFSTDKEGES